jgi:hypothetical protein
VSSETLSFGNISAVQRKLFGLCGVVADHIRLHFGFGNGYSYYSVSCMTSWEMGCTVSNGVPKHLTWKGFLKAWVTEACS